MYDQKQAEYIFIFNHLNYLEHITFHEPISI